MKKTIPFLLLILLYSCTPLAKKLRTNNNFPLIKTWVIGGNSYSTKVHYKYDEKQRLVEQNGQYFEKKSNNEWIETTSPNEKPVIYTYFKDSILVDVNNTWNRIILDEKGLFVRDESPNEFSKTKAITSRLKHTYNKEGYLIKLVLFDDYVSYSYSTIYLYEYKNGNMIKTTHKNRNIDENGFVNESSYTITYEYHNDLPNTIGNTQFGKSYLGRSNKNLIKKERNSNNYSATYNYDFDKQGKIIRLRHINDENGMVVRDYKYEYY